MKKVAILGVIVFTLIHIMGCGDDCDDCGKEGTIGNVQVGEVVPDFSVVLNNGKTVNKKSLEGKVSIVLFFTTTCPDCRALFPSIERIYNEYKDNTNFEIVAISREQEASIVDGFWKESGYTFPYSAQKTRDVYSLFAQSIVPRVYITNEKCVVQSIFTDDPVASYDELIDVIDELLNILCCKG